jgi:hypothetical protein
LGQLRWAAAVAQSYSCAYGRAINASACPASRVPHQENDGGSAGVTSVRHAETCRADQVPRLQPVTHLPSSATCGHRRATTLPPSPFWWRPPPGDPRCFTSAQTPPVRVCFAVSVAASSFCWIAMLRQWHPGSHRRIAESDRDDRSSATGYATAVPRSSP